MVHWYRTCQICILSVLLPVAVRFHSDLLGWVWYSQRGGVERDALRHVSQRLVGAAHLGAATLALGRAVGARVAAVLAVVTCRHREGGHNKLAHT